MLFRSKRASVAAFRALPADGATRARFPCTGGAGGRLRIRLGIRIYYILCSSAGSTPSLVGDGANRKAKVLHRGRAPNRQAIQAVAGAFACLSPAYPGVVHRFVPGLDRSSGLRGRCGDTTARRRQPSRCGAAAEAHPSWSASPNAATHAVWRLVCVAAGRTEPVGRSSGRRRCAASARFLSGPTHRVSARPTALTVGRPSGRRRCAASARFLSG